MAERPAADETLPTPPPRKTKDRAVRVGFFLLVGLTATLGVLFTMTDAALFRGRYIVTTYVTDAGGIRRGDPVQMRGVNIGRVQRFKIDPEGTVAVRLEIEGEYDIPADSYVQLKSSGLLGGMVAEVVPGRSPQKLGYGSTLSGKSQEGGDSTTRIANQVESALARVEALLSTDMIQDVHGSTAELQRLLKDLSAAVGEQRRELAGLGVSLKRSATGLERATSGPELERTVKRLDTLTQRMDELTVTLDRSSRSVETVLGRIERGEGTLGKLTTDGALYDNLNQAALNLNQATINVNKLTEEIRRNPRRYLKLSVF